MEELVGWLVGWEKMDTEGEAFDSLLSASLSLSLCSATQPQLRLPRHLLFRLPRPLLALALQELPLLLGAQALELDVPRLALAPLAL